MSAQARKILRRTLSGGALTGTLVLLLWLTSRSPDGEPVFYAAALVLLAAVYELGRMGRLATLGLQWVLLAPALALGALHFAALRADRRAASHALLPEALTGAYRENLGLELALVGLLALVAFALVRGSWWRPRALGAVALALGLTAFVVALTRDPLQAGVTLRFTLLVLAGLALLCVPALLAVGQRRELVATLALALWLVPPLPCLWHVWRAWDLGGLVALLVLSKIGDTAGYYVGSAIGRRHPFPNISPGKTLAGCVASLVTATCLGGILAAAGVLPAGRFGVAGGLACGAALNLAAQAGDLLESWIKRRAEVKDSSTWFGPSGGLLDQLDSLLASIPVAVLLWPWLFAPS